MGASSSHEDRNCYQFFLFFFFSWIFVMDTGIFLLSIIFIRYWVCCQNTWVINTLRVYITTLPEAVRSRQRFLMFPVRWALPTAVRAAPGTAQRPSPACVRHASARVGCFLKYHVPQLRHLQTAPLSAARFCCSLCHGITDLMHGVVLFFFFILKAHQICSLVRLMKSLLLSWRKLQLICVFNRKKAFFPTVT